MCQAGRRLTGICISPFIYCLVISQPSESPRIASTYIGHVERIPESQGGLRADLSAEVAGEGGGGTSDAGRGGKGSGASGERESDNGLHRFGIIRGYYRAGNQINDGVVHVVLGIACRWRLACPSPLLSFGRPIFACCALHTFSRILWGGTEPERVLMSVTRLVCPFAGT